ncbi:integrin-linked kinase-associated serine/threonine phosphatase 2C-like [Pocillopora verrucosa]|uniref:integrin-linked kinase-associated serine/threonine phosphatase 2C-like n=1 Tax=Pocillopora verrucosa TaxID=203993 RepID=UPI0033423A0A
MDDLFGDLPPPSRGNNESSSAGNLHDDLPSSEKIEDKKRKLEATEEDACTPAKRPLKQSKYKLRGFVAERKGERNDMQDAHVINNDFLDEFGADKPLGFSRMCYYGVFDGHAGPKAAQFAAEHLHKNIVLKFPKGEAANKDKEIKRCVTDAYKKTDEEFLLEASKASPVWKDGSTAVTALVMDDVLYVANLGDSRALLCRCGENGETSVVSLSKDHSPSQYEERMRIQKAGGTVREGRVLGVLEVSRSIGDGRFKRCGVSCIPDVMRCTLTDNDRYLLLACDGLWKGFSVDSALKFINNILETENSEETSQKTENNTGLEDIQLDPVSARFQDACNKIASEAIRNGSSDNVTVMLVSITKQ